MCFASGESLLAQIYHPIRQHLWKRRHLLRQQRKPEPAVRVANRARVVSADRQLIQVPSDRAIEVKLGQSVAQLSRLALRVYLGRPIGDISLFAQFEANTRLTHNPVRNYGNMPLAILTSEKTPVSALPAEQAAAGPLAPSHSAQPPRPDSSHRRSG